MTGDDDGRPRADGADWTRHPAAARLLTVHALLRRDVAGVRATVAELDAGYGSVRRAQDAVDAVTGADGEAAWRTRCLLFCGFLGSHHEMEDGIFPQLAGAEPGLRPVVDRLLHEHHEVAVLLGQVRAELARDVVDLPAVRSRLDTLADHLDAHLAYEEEHIGPALARLA